MDPCESWQLSCEALVCAAVLDVYASGTALDRFGKPPSPPVNSLHKGCVQGLEGFAQQPRSRQAQAKSPPSNRHETLLPKSRVPADGRIRKVLV